VSETWGKNAALATPNLGLGRNQVLFSVANVRPALK
jgi:hypothetical protein